MTTRKLVWPLLVRPAPAEERGDRASDPTGFDEFVGQEQVVETLRTAVEASHKSGKRLPHILLADQRHGIGKRLALSTPLPTPTGWTTMGEVQAGDALYDMDGNICHVTALTEIESVPAFRLVFDTGETILACADHQWVTSTLSGSKNGLRLPQSVVTTAAMAETVHMNGAKNHAIPFTAINGRRVDDLPVDPWLLGYWLGNGNTSNGVIHTGGDGKSTYDRPFVCQKITSLGEVITSVSTSEANPFTSTVIVEGLRGRLRTLGVLGNKHIPDMYLRASLDQRLALMQGLMDSDGTATPPSDRGGNYRYGTVRKELLDGFVELSYSLGIRTSVYNQRYDQGGDRGIHSSFRVHFRSALPVFTLPRKAERMVARGKPTRRYVQAVERTGVWIPMRCISVDSPSGTYLCGRGMIPTHNTTLAKITAAEMQVALRIVMGSVSAHEAVRIMQNMADGDIVLWDEIHTAKSVDWLLPFMQSGVVVLPNGGVSVPDVSLIAATTKPEVLDPALLSRFVLRPQFQQYTVEDMEKLLSSSINDSEVRKVIVTVSGGNPRELLRVETIAQGLVQVGRITAAAVLAHAGYGSSGLPASVETLLLALWASPSFTAGKSSLSALVGPEFEVAEAVALERELISVTGRGRRLTRAGIDVATVLAEEQ